MFSKFGAKVAHWPRKNPLHLDGNQDQGTVRVTVGLGLRLTFHVILVRTVLRLGES